MDTQQIQQVEANAWKHYDNADSAGKELLHNVFGSDFFKRSIMDKVKTFEDACKVLNIEQAIVTTNEDTIDEAAYKQLKVIVRALNEGWTPDWDNEDQYKYYPYFDMSAGFSFDYSGDYYRVSFVGSRLCFCSRELSDYAAKQFLPIYRAFLTK